MEALPVALLSLLALGICWKASAPLLQRIAGQGLVLWPPSFVLGFLVDEVFFSVALFFSLAPLLLWIRSLWADNDSGEGPDDPWDYIPYNPMGDKGKKSKDLLRG